MKSLYKRGEIVTALTIAGVIILTVVTLVSNVFLSKNKQTTKTLAAGTPSCASGVSEGASCSNNGEWCISCTGNQGPCNSDAGVGIPYQCQNGSWKNTNQYGECNLTCVVSNPTTPPNPTSTPGGQCNPNDCGNWHCGGGQCDKCGVGPWYWWATGCWGFTGHGPSQTGCCTPCGNSNLICQNPGVGSCGNDGCIHGAPPTNTPAPKATNTPVPSSCGCGGGGYCNSYCTNSRVNCISNPSICYSGNPKVTNTPTPVVCNQMSYQACKGQNVDTGCFIDETKKYGHCQISNSPNTCDCIANPYQPPTPTSPPIPTSTPTPNPNCFCQVEVARCTDSCGERSGKDCTNGGSNYCLGVVTPTPNPNKCGWMSSLACETRSIGDICSEGNKPGTCKKTGNDIAGAPICECILNPTSAPAGGQAAQVGQSQEFTVQQDTTVAVPLSNPQIVNVNGTSCTMIGNNYCLAVPL